jgi:hypothetical protein
MYIIKRRLSAFNLDLEYDGEKVKVKDGEKTIDAEKVKGFKNAGEKMREIEEEMHQACQAMG